MNQNFKLLIVLLVAVNAAMVGWLLLRPETAPSANLSQPTNVMDDLLKDNTMEAARHLVCVIIEFPPRM